MKKKIVFMACAAAFLTLCSCQPEMRFKYTSPNKSAAGAPATFYEDLYNDFAQAGYQLGDDFRLDIDFDNAAFSRLEKLSSDKSTQYLKVYSGQKHYVHVMVRGSIDDIELSADQAVAMEAVIEDELENIRLDQKTRTSFELYDNTIKSDGPTPAPARGSKSDSFEVKLETLKALLHRRFAGMIVED